MLKVILITLTIIAAFLAVHGGPDAKIVQEFCEVILLQSKADSTQCFDKPRGYTSKGDKAVLIFLCCLGFFQDVTHNYIPYIHMDFLDFIGGLETDKHVIDIAHCIKMCKTNSSDPITKADYNYWLNNGKTLQVCRKRML